MLVAIEADRRLGSTAQFGEITDAVDLLRLESSRKLRPQSKAEYGQFFTPEATALRLASLFQTPRDSIRLLDAGAGVGSLTAAFVQCAAERSEKPMRIDVTAYEVDANLARYLEVTNRLCQRFSREHGMDFGCEIHNVDFLEESVTALRGGFFAPPRQTFNAAILNPPYRKISTDSRARALLRSIGVEVSNLYAAFVTVAIDLLEQGGELVAITPRSFCNGPYFRPFREKLLRDTRITHIHLFESRERAFEDDEVLQENIIFRVVKGGVDRIPVVITSSDGPDAEIETYREVPFEEVVRPDDPERFIHIVPDGNGNRIVEAVSRITTSLAETGLSVSTGRVVDFRAEEHLRYESVLGSVPLIYPQNVVGGFIQWPSGSPKKPVAIVDSVQTANLLVPAGYYVLVKRFTSKEERRRVVAAVYDPDCVIAPRVGFENHLNYFHRSGQGTSWDLATGLAAYLNSELVDQFFRQFNGHTQVNATDLRMLPYPSETQLSELGRRIGTEFPTQAVIDELVSEVLSTMPDDGSDRQQERRLEEAREALRALGFPPAQSNLRSALTLLALLDLSPDTPWRDARRPLRGITQMMDFFAQHYGMRYAPDTRETVRRQTVHQFLNAGLLIANPDDPRRAINSGKTVYQLDPEALAVLQSFGGMEWEARLLTYRESVTAISQQHAQERQQTRIPLALTDEVNITLSPGGQNVLIEQVIREFCPRFVPGGTISYVGDTDEKFAYFDETTFQSLGIVIDPHGKMPDVIVYDAERQWLVIVEAVISHGPIDLKRRQELRRLFSGFGRLVYVTAFLDRRAMVRYLKDIAWETEVWVADAPSHLIHFDGERFLGPFDEAVD